MLYVFCFKVEVELICLEKEGIFFKVEYSEWVILIVLVVKWNGLVWVCGDFKVLVNLVFFVE